LTATQLRNATIDDLPEITLFLKDNELPTNGVKECVENFIVAMDEDRSWVGIAGLEVYGKSGLLRSVAVDKNYRGMGHGQSLVEAVLKEAREKGVERIYLLTENAEVYFKGLGFEVISRENVDEGVRASPEFRECCATAVAMRRSTPTQ
jgi:amino-acid N-acetyltransferase